MYLGSLSHRGRHVVSPSATFHPNVLAASNQYQKLAEPQDIVAGVRKIPRTLDCQPPRALHTHTE
jgi:hypothetical protein